MQHTTLSRERAVGNRYWVFKSEPGGYSYDDLERDGVAEWDGVRNYQARNLLRDEVQEGDGVLFYHSSTTEPAVVGTAVVVRSGHPDYTAWDPDSGHYDPRSTPEAPVWYMVDIRPTGKLSKPVTLGDMHQVPELEGMLLLRRGVRLSVQPATEQEWHTICRLGGRQP